MSDLELLCATIVAVDGGMLPCSVYCGVSIFFGLGVSCVCTLCDWRSNKKWFVGIF